LKYFTTVNNFEMPPYIRLDFGCSLKFNQDKRCHHTLNVGIYNVLNRHNPFSLTYDTEERTWKKVSIFPIMPSLNWTIEF
ncbi:MAG TPA: TonB-dependent receptor, partial [Rikenellaceae bacterium]|nr:TonB-dependent receptor [Rikenellaceae bacterium]